ncbi:MAG TPA: DUF1499 domain-containing protein [Gammaproteobacteria bacterium]|nr:DUF1499 domain-containing protein [Gammaproteobacteria bacterium]
MPKTRIQRRGFLVAALALAAAGCSTILVPDYGVRQGHLEACPPNSDCVSSQDQDPDRYIAPLAFTPSHDTSSRDKAHDDLITAVSNVGEGRIVSNHTTYIRVQFPALTHPEHNSQYSYQPESAVDEVEFYLQSTGKIEMRSVAKLGLLDNGANRDRLEKIRAVFDRLQQVPSAGH